MPTLVLLGSFLVPATFVAWAFEQRESGEITAELVFRTFMFRICTVRRYSLTTLFHRAGLPLHDRVANQQVSLLGVLTSTARCVVSAACHPCQQGSGSSEPTGPTASSADARGSGGTRPHALRPAGRPLLDPRQRARQ